MFDKRKFKAQMILVGVTSKELAEKLGINESTLYRKINSDGNFTRTEINKLILLLRIDDPKEIFLLTNLRKRKHDNQLIFHIRQRPESLKGVSNGIHGAYTGKERKVIVTQFLRKMLLHKNITLSDEELDMLIEAAVKEMNMKDFKLIPIAEGEVAKE